MKHNKKIQRTKELISVYLKNPTLSYDELGDMFRITKQRVYQIFQEENITKIRSPRKVWVKKETRVCKNHTCSNTFVVYPIKTKRYCSSVCFVKERIFVSQTRTRRRCGDCKVVKHINYFTKRTVPVSGVIIASPYCTPCATIRGQKIRAKNPEHYKAYDREYGKRRRLKQKYSI